MKLLWVLFMASVFAAAMLAIPASPAMAQSSEDSLIYFPVPDGAGGTYLCGSGPPFVSELGSGEDNCTDYQSGAPAGLACDTLTPITFVPTDPEVPGLTRLDSYGLLCH